MFYPFRMEQGDPAPNGQIAPHTSPEDVKDALWRAVLALLSTRLGPGMEAGNRKTCREESRHGTQECVRHILCLFANSEFDSFTCFARGVNDVGVRPS